MSTLQKNISIGVFGGEWANATKDFLKTAGICPNNIHLFEYVDRESLFFDQDDIFIITDFGMKENDSWNANKGYWLNRLNEFREVIYSRSMKSVIFANDTDVDVSKSLRDACSRVVRVDTSNKSIPHSLATAVSEELLRRNTRLKTAA